MAFSTAPDVFANNSYNCYALSRDGVNDYRRERRSIFSGSRGRELRLASVGFLYGTIS
jgi:hypothetical protein